MELKSFSTESSSGHPQEKERKGRKRECKQRGSGGKEQKEKKNKGSWGLQEKNERNHTNEGEKENKGKNETGRKLR